MGTYEKFGKLLAETLNEHINDFDRLFSEGHFKIDKVNALKEWICFNMFIILQGIGAYFKDIKDIDKHKVGLLLDAFHNSCCDICTNKGAFANSNELIEVLTLSRYPAYLEALNDSSAGPLWRFGEEFCKRCGEDVSPATIVFASIYFTGGSIATKKFMKDLNIAKQL